MRAFGDVSYKRHNMLSVFHAGSDEMAGACPSHSRPKTLHFLLASLTLARVFVYYLYIVVSGVLVSGVFRRYIAFYTAF